MISTCAIGFVKIKYLPVKPSNDDLYRQVDSAAWSLGELCAAIVVACLPVLRPLFSPNYRAAVRRKMSRFALGQGCGRFRRRSTAMAPEQVQLESGEIQQPNFELEKALPAMETLAINIHNQSETGEIHKDTPSGNADHTHSAPLVDWPAEANGAAPASPAPVHSRHMHGKRTLNFTTASV